MPSHIPASLHLKSHATSHDKHPSPSSSDEFIRFAATMRLPLAPVWSADGAAGGQLGREVSKVFDRYLPPLQCVLLTFSPTPTFIHPTSTFPSHASPFPPLPSTSSARSRLALTSREDDDDSKPSHDRKTPDEDEEDEKVYLKVLPMISGTGFGLPIVHFTGIGWRPRVGQKIVGSPTLSTPSHVSLLLHNLFNATLPASHIPSDEWRFDPDYVVPAFIRDRQKMSFPTTTTTTKVKEEEAEMGAQGEDGEGGGEREKELAQEEEARLAMEEDEMYADRGWWVNLKTGEPMGGQEGSVQFTIVSLTIANSMITVTGSLLPSPFSSKIPAQNPIIATYRSGLSNAADVLRRHTTDEHNRKRKEMAKELGEDDDDEESESESEEEGLARLGRGERETSMSPVDKVPIVKEEAVGSIKEGKRESKGKKDKRKKEKEKKKRKKDE
ncbi:BQ2448_3951 [Microbotryum intermedium]|uniref:BQ2448_3951 protein n=1 Tax=Microbotryum intermedium TaxID=269621 RepID=A0A238FKJ7_9BASI|nr:BQ2448_3951 [Microbotryum intermedium]